MSAASRAVAFARRGLLAISLTALALAAVAALCDHAAAAEGHGYNNTPMLPNSPWRVHDAKRPQPPMVAPGERPGQPPADAVVLFDGTNLDAWEGGRAESIEDGAINILKTDGLRTKRSFGDCQLHIEWATPAKADAGPMSWGNSGVFFLGLHELQIIESHDSQIYADGIAGAIYGQTPPLANASRRPGEWQTFDAVFTAPRFDGEKLVAPARFTVFWNGVLVQLNTASLGPTQHLKLASYASRETTGPITLQKHGSAARYRNIWLRPLKLSQ
jgi:hypothetical protein